MGVGRGSLLVILAFVLLGCDGGMPIPPSLQGLLPASLGPRNVVEVDGFRFEMKWCSVSPSRTAECEFVATSLHRDFKGGISYPKMQDDQGSEYRMNRTDGSAGFRVMIAGQQYTRRLVTTNLPTYVTQVRGISAGFALRTVDRGLNAGEHQLVFADIPQRPTSGTAGPATAAAVAPAPQAERPTVAAAAIAPAAIAPAPAGPDISGSHWFGTIVPVVDMPQSASEPIFQLWERGAYIHLREDGIAGYNWSEPGVYIYDGVNRWVQSGSRYTLTMNGAAYTFETASPEPTLIAYLEQGGMFVMNMTRKAAGQR